MLTHNLWASLTRIFSFIRRGNVKTETITANQHGAVHDMRQTLQPRERAQWI